jgi:hypothetical protein
VRWNGTAPERRAETASARRDDIDLRPFYGLLRSEALIFHDFKSTAPLNGRLDMRRNITASLTRRKGRDVSISV